MYLPAAEVIRDVVTYRHAISIRRITRPAPPAAAAAATCSGSDAH